MYWNYQVVKSQIAKLAFGGIALVFLAGLLFMTALASVPYLMILILVCGTAGAAMLVGAVVASVIANAIKPYNNSVARSPTE